MGHCVAEVMAYFTVADQFFTVVLMAWFCQWGSYLLDVWMENWLYCAITFRIVCEKNSIFVCE